MKRYEIGKSKINNIKELNSIIQSELEKNKLANMEDDSNDEIVPPSPIKHCENDISSFEFTEILENLQRIQEEEYGNEFEYEEINEEEEITDMITIIQSNQDSILLEEEEIYQLDELKIKLLEVENERTNLKIRNYRTIVLEKDPTVRSSSLNMLKFPQLSICYHFNYFKYITEKSIAYSILSYEKEREVPLNQITLGDKPMKSPKNLFLKRKAYFRIFNYK